MKSRWNRFVVGILCAGAIALGGCMALPVLTGTGTLKLLITDKPFPFDFITKATVEITKVEVRGVPTSQPADDSTEADSDKRQDPQGQDQAGDSDEDGGSPFITIFEDPAGKEFNLLDLRNGKTDLLADATIPAGTYTQMRLIVTGGEVTLTDGRTFPLKVPSGEESGIKLNFTFTVVAGQDNTLILDVDLSRAFSAIPSGHIDDVSTIREFRFQPSIAMRLIDVLAAGKITGTVTDSAASPLANVSVAAVQGGQDVATTATDQDGKYTLNGLTTGTYTVDFSLTGFQDVSVPNVAVTAGTTTANVNATLTATTP